MSGGAVRPIGPGDAALPGALALVWRVFEAFEAPEYPPEGVEEFRAFIAPGAVAEAMAGGRLRLWGYFEHGALLGVSGLRPPAHICLLFVDAAHHRRGIARRLVTAMQAAAGGAGRFTVNSSPYAQGAYERLGFVAEGPEQVVNGLRFVPMAALL